MHKTMKEHLYEKGENAFENKEYNKAVEFFEKYLELDPDNQEVRWAFIKSLILNGCLIDAVGYILVQYDEEDDTAFDIVTKFGFEDFRERVEDDLDDKDQQELSMDILNRMKFIIQEYGIDEFPDLIKKGDENDQ